MPRGKQLSRRKCLGCRCLNVNKDVATCSLGITVIQIQYEGWIDYKPSKVCDKPVTHAAYSQHIYNASGIGEIIPLEYVS